MYLEIFLADFAVFRVFFGILRDFVEIPEFRGSATARNIRSPGNCSTIVFFVIQLWLYFIFTNQNLPALFVLSNSLCC